MLDGAEVVAGRVVVAVARTLHAGRKGQERGDGSLAQPEAVRYLAAQGLLLVERTEGELRVGLDRSYGGFTTRKEVRRMGQRVENLEYGEALAVLDRQIQGYVNTPQSPSDLDRDAKYAEAVEKLRALDGEKSTSV